VHGGDDLVSGMQALLCGATVFRASTMSPPELLDVRTLGHALALQIHQGVLESRFIRLCVITVGRALVVDAHAPRDRNIWLNPGVFRFRCQVKIVLARVMLRLLLYLKVFCRCLVSEHLHVGSLDRFTSVSATFTEQVSRVEPLRFLFLVQIDNRAVKGTRQRTSYTFATVFRW